METRHKARLRDPVIKSDSHREAKRKRRSSPVPTGSDQAQGREGKSSRSARSHFSAHGPPTSPPSSSSHHPDPTDSRRLVVVVSSRGTRSKRPGSPHDNGNDTSTSKRPDRESIPQTIHTLQQENENLRLQVQSLTQSRNDNSAFEQERLQHGETKQLLEARTTELQSLKAFIGPMSNAVTEAEVKAMVVGLNNEIAQVSAILADSLSTQVRKAIHPRDYQAAANRLASGDVLLDEFTLDKLWSADSNALPFRAQVALQACMTYTCVLIIEYISIRDIRVIENLAEQVSQFVPFPVYAKWRALTHQHTVRPEERARFWLKRLTAKVEDVLFIAGFVQEAGRLQERLSRVVGMAVALNLTTKQQMFSTDAVALHFCPGESFNSEAMQIGYSSDANQTSSSSSSSSSHARHREQILCTTGIGLYLEDTITRESVVALKSAVAMRNVFEDDSDSV